MGPGVPKLHFECLNLSVTDLTCILPIRRHFSSPGRLHTQTRGIKFCKELYAGTRLLLGSKNAFFTHARESGVHIRHKIRDYQTQSVSKMTVFIWKEGIERSLWWRFLDRFDDLVFSFRRAIGAEHPGKRRRRPVGVGALFCHGLGRGRLVPIYSAVILTWLESRRERRKDRSRRERTVESAFGKCGRREVRVGDDDEERLPCHCRRVAYYTGVSQTHTHIHMRFCAHTIRNTLTHALIRCHRHPNYSNHSVLDGWCVWLYIFFPDGTQPFKHVPSSYGEGCTKPLSNDLSLSQ